MAQLVCTSDLPHPRANGLRRAEHVQAVLYENHSKNQMSIIDAVNFLYNRVSQSVAYFKIIAGQIPVVPVVITLAATASSETGGARISDWLPG